MNARDIDGLSREPQNERERVRQSFRSVSRKGNRKRPARDGVRFILTNFRKNLIFFEMSASESLRKKWSTNRNLTST